MKVDSIEHYSISSLFKMKDVYEDFMEKTEGLDPDFPMIDFGNKGQTIKGKNKVQAIEETKGTIEGLSSNMSDDFFDF
jgi:hypothetical protein